MADDPRPAHDPDYDLAASEIARERTDPLFAVASQARRMRDIR